MPTQVSKTPCWEGQWEHLAILGGSPLVQNDVRDVHVVRDVGVVRVVRVVRNVVQSAMAVLSPMIASAAMATIVKLLMVSAVEPESRCYSRQVIRVVFTSIFDYKLQKSKMAAREIFAVALVSVSI